MHALCTNTFGIFKSTTFPTKMCATKGTQNSHSISVFSAASCDLRMPQNDFGYWPFFTDVYNHPTCIKQAAQWAKVQEYLRPCTKSYSPYISLALQCFTTHTIIPIFVFKIRNLLSPQIATHSPRIPHTHF